MTTGKTRPLLQWCERCRFHTPQRSGDSYDWWPGVAMTPTHCIECDEPSGHGVVTLDRAAYDAHEEATRGK